METPLIVGIAVVAACAALFILWKAFKAAKMVGCIVVSFFVVLCVTLAVIALGFKNNWFE